MNLKTLDDLWDNQLTIRPGHRFDLRSMNDVGVNNLGHIRSTECAMQAGTCLTLTENAECPDI